MPGGARACREAGESRWYGHAAGRCRGAGASGQEAAAVPPPDEEAAGFAVCVAFEDEDEDEEVEADESGVEDVEEDGAAVVPASVLVAVERESLR